MAGPHVFEDGRLGLWMYDVDRGLGRLAAIRERMPYVTDLFWPGSEASAGVKSDTLEAGFTGCHGYWSVRGETAQQYAARVLSDVARWSPGAGDLNIELGSDAALGPYMRIVAVAIRAVRRSYRLRLNIAWRKAGFLPIDLVQSDANLYACEQNYVDTAGSTMEPTSAADALEHLLAAGVPLRKAAICYGAAGPVWGRTRDERVVTLPHGDGWTPSRGVIFQDDLCSEVGLL